MSSRTIELEFLGQKVVVKTDRDADFTEEVVRLVTSKLVDAEGRARGVAAHQVALLALLELAEDYLLAKKRTLDHVKKMNGKSSELSSLIESIR